LNSDPETALGAESTPYVVRPGDSLGTIAKRFMGDVCEFWILARYNQIKIPKHLPVGQTIRIPGRVAVAAPPPPQLSNTDRTQQAAEAERVRKAAEAEKARKAAESEKARKSAEAEKTQQAAEAEKTRQVAEAEKARKAAEAEKARRAEIERHYRNGHNALRRQALGTAIQEFDAVLVLDPGHSGAKVYRQQAQDLQAKILNK
jgi:LysM repeat protein